eukprot:385288-Pleurochrysis_carterae.AAC.1
MTSAAVSGAAPSGAAPCNESRRRRAAHRVACEARERSAPCAALVCAEFRANRLEQDGAKAAAMIEQARIGLGSLKAQSGLGKRSGDEQYSFDAR